MNKTTLIFKHEFLQEIKKASYILMTLIVPVLGLLAILIFRLVFPAPASAPASAPEVVQAAPAPTQGYVGDPNIARIIVPGVFALLLGLALMFGATSLITGLAEEKESRLIQVLFSSVSIRQLLVGKVLALGTAGLLQVLVWLISTPLLLGLASAWFGGFMSRMQIPGNFLVLGLIYFILGYLLFAVLSIGVGAIVSNPREGTNLSLIYTLGSFIPLWLSSLNMFFPNSWIWAALTIFPITAPIMTMLRLGTSIVPTWQIVVSIGVLVLSIVAGLSLSIKLFRVHMLMYGKRPGLKQLVQSLREAKSVSEATETSSARAAAGKTARLFFVDHLRAALAILVVLHHVAMVYGASSPFYYVEPPFTDPLAFVSLLVFALLNQAWFMGAFFLLAGYFVPRSYDRKGPGAFVAGKLVRLGIPMLITYFVLNPIARLGAYLMPPELTGITSAPTWAAYPRFLGLGPLWFALMLLVFCLGYVAWRMLAGKRSESARREDSGPGYLGVGLFVLALAGASYLMRMVIPLGKSVWEFPTLAYLPQYLGFFVVGTVAYRRNWFRTLPGSMGTVGLVAALVAAVVLFPLAFSGQLFSLDLAALDNSMGNGHWQSAVYVLFDSIFSVGLSLGAIVVFRRFFNRESRFGRFLAQHSYAVYVLHIPVVIYLAYLLRGAALPSLLKFGLASLIIVPACFVVATIVRKIPLVSKVL